MRLHLIFFIFFFSVGDIISQVSILSDGEWFKIGVVESGVYKLDKNFFDINNISLEGISPDKIKIYGSGYNGSLPQLNSQSEIIGPQQIQSLFSGNQDSKFSDNEFLYFYLQSSDKIYFDSLENNLKVEKNIYTDTAYYFIHIGGEARTLVHVENNPNAYNREDVSAFHTFNYENDMYSIIQSGREWYGEIFSPGESFSIPFDNFISNTDLKLEINLISRSTVPSSFDFYLNNNLVSDVDMDLVKDNLYGNKVLKKRKIIKSKFELSSSNSLELKYNGVNSAISYLDNINITGRVELRYNGSQFHFYILPEYENIITKYKIKSSKIFGEDLDGILNLRTWDISYLYNVKSMDVNRDGDDYFFINDDSIFSRKILFDIDNLSYPFYEKKIQNSDILDHQNPNLLIITHEIFYDDARRIKQLRESEGLKVKLVDVDNIYNQFSSGNKDVTSIRNYIKYIYNFSDENLKYVLLFGDCSYDYKDRIPNNTNYIPIYQSYNSSNNIFSYSSDDYYGFLDGGEGEWIENLSGDHELNVGVGRIPSKNLNESKSYVDKLYTYSSKNKIIGDWKKNIYLVADDGDNNVHQNDAENHFDLLDNESKDYNIKKIYLDSYDQKLTNGVKTSEQAKNKLDKAVENGSLIINYIGHGNEFLWTEEKILDENSIYNWDNRTKLPLFLTATCEFGKFDDPLITSGGELLLNKENGGAIALFTTTRPVFSQTNYRLNSQFYKNVFKKVDNQFYRLGDIFKETKNGSLSGSINRNFALLGDPSLQLSYPKFNIKINGIDTLMAGGKVYLSGEIVDDNNVKREDFNGELFTEIYDKISSKLTLGDESTPYQYREWDDLIFKGISSINDGSFTIEFVVPSSIEYHYGIGKISLFAADTISYLEAIDNQTVIIGGTSNEFDNDVLGPEIEIFLDDYDFVSGSTVSKSPLLIVDLFDKSGLNITETKTFHMMSAIIDDTTEVYLNDYFSPSKDDYTRGLIRYPLNNLSGGKHKVEIKVSDNYNNMSTSSVVFIVGSENKLNITNLVNYPNPFNQITNFKFTNGEIDQPLEIKLEVYDLRGNIVFSLNKIYEFSPELIDDIQWNGKDLNNYPLPQGIYIYKLQVNNLLNGAKIILHNKLFKKI